ncbi:hypothetical protein [Bradyrhizobium guangdongense]
MGRALPALAVLFSVGLTYEPVLAQSGSDIVNIFGGLVQTAITQATQAEWRKIPAAEMSCIDENLRQRGLSIAQAVQQGISPGDGRLADVRRFCRSGLAQNPSGIAVSPSVISIYAVDGLNLGAKVNFESSVYRQYQCSPSEQFNGFSWCTRKVAESSRRGPFVSSYSILHSPDGTVSYVNRYLEPAWFSGNEANEDIGRLARKYGQPNVMAMPQAEGVQGLMASWGTVTLLPLDANNLALLAQGRDIRAGLMVDFLGNFRRSAQLGLPIYRLAGGPGFVWAANWDQGGRGTLRFFAVDASTFAGPAPVQPQVQANLGTSSIADSAASEPASPSPPPVSAAQPSPPVSTAPPPPPASPPPAVTRINPDERARQRIKDTLSRVSYHRGDLPNDNFKTKLDAIASRLAAVSNGADSATLKTLMSDCDAASAIFDEAAEFTRVSEIAGRKVAIVNAKLQGISFDAPLVQDLKTAVGGVGNAQTEGDLAALKAALSSLNALYDTGRLDRLATAKANGFETIESYDDYKDRQSRLSGSGIILNKK